MTKIGFDKVWLQEVMVPKWVRGPKEFALIETQPGITFNVDVCALGGSVATPSVGIKSNVVEVTSFEELKLLGKKEIDGKIVFYNRPMQPNLVSTFQAYGEAVDQRVNGAFEAIKYGAIGVIVRSMSLRLDDIPHTGTMSYGNLPSSKRIPAAAISTNAAEKLSKLLKINPNLKFLLRQQCKTYGRGGFDGAGMNMDDIFSQFGDIFGSAFGGGSGFGGFGGGGSRVSKGSNLRIRVQLELSEVVLGAEKKIKVKRKIKADGVTYKTCSTCNGSGQVTRITNTILGRMQSSTTCPSCGGSGQVVSNRPSNADSNGLILKEETVYLMSN